jgi:hypothetical protein
MDKLTKQRYISTSIWSDDWYDSLSKIEKLFYFYLLTNQHTNPAGIYPCTLRDMRVDFEESREEILRMLKKFEEAGKTFYYEGYIIVPKWLKHQKISDRSKMFLGAISVIKALPDEIKAFAGDRRHYDFDIAPYIGGSSACGQTCAEATFPEETSFLESDENTKNDSLSEKDGKNAIGYRKNGEKDDSLSEKDGKKGIAYAENAVKTAHDSDVDVDVDTNSVVVVDNLSSRENEHPPGNSATTTNFLDIQKKAKSVGYCLAKKQAADFLRLDNSWLSGSHSFFDFAAQKIREDRVYSAKDQSERERIFAKGWDYQNWILEYPGWREKQTKADKSRELELLRKTPPRKCLGCGADLNGGQICGKCGGRHAFSGETLSWELDMPDPDFSIRKSFLQTLKENRADTGLPKEAEG